MFYNHSVFKQCPCARAKDIKLRKENVEQILDDASRHGAKIVAVTKYFDFEKINEYYSKGFRNFGENRVKDALEKINKLDKEIVKNSKFHLIGHLQTNKAKDAAGNFDLIHSLDSEKLADEISVRAKNAKVVQDVLIQLNNANEEQKFGISKESIEKLFEHTLKLDSIRVRGLMNIAPLNVSEKELHKLFEDVRLTRDKLEEKFYVKLEELSMGMSNDYKIALEEGATILRLGRILFNN